MFILKPIIWVYRKMILSDTVWVRHRRAGPDVIVEKKIPFLPIGRPVHNYRSGINELHRKLNKQTQAVLGTLDALKLAEDQLAVDAKANDYDSRYVTEFFPMSRKEFEALPGEVLSQNQDWRGIIHPAVIKKRGIADQKSQEKKDSATIAGMKTSKSVVFQQSSQLPAAALGTSLKEQEGADEAYPYKEPDTKKDNNQQGKNKGNKNKQQQNSSNSGGKLNPNSIDGVSDKAPG